MRVSLEGVIGEATLRRRYTGPGGPMSTFSYDSGLPPDPPRPPAPARPSAAVSAAHRRELSAEELASLPLQALLVRSGRLSIDQLSDALRENVSTGLRAVEDIAVSRGWVPADELEELRRAKAAYVAPEPAPEPPAPAVEFVAPTLPPPPAPVAPAPVAPVAPQPPPIAAVPEPPARSAPPIVQTNENGVTGGSVGVFSRRLPTASASGWAASPTPRPASGGRKRSSTS